MVLDTGSPLRMVPHRPLALALFACSLLAASSAARAQDAYPSRAITLIVPFAAGGASDVIARVAAEDMGHTLGQTLVIENVGGAGGSIALTRVARAAPDGYTLLAGNAGTNAAAYSLYPKLAFTPDSFEPIGMIAKTSGVLAIKPAFPAATLADFVAYAKKNPGVVTLGHAGVGSSNHLICLSFIRAAQVEVSLVSYRGGAPALNDLVGGHIDGVCDNATSVSGMIKASKARGLAIAGPARLASLPDVPAAAEAGLPDFQAEGWNALFAPKGVAPAVVARLNAALRKAVASDAMKARLLELSASPASEEETTPAYVAALVPREVEKYRVLIGKDPNKN